MSRKTRRNASTDVATPIHVAVRPGLTGMGISGFALGTFALSGSVFAADAAPAAPASNDNTDTLQEVVVTGIRASLQKSLDIKEQSLGVVDAISAEDIGAFPDASLGEAMQRVPGVTVTRTVQGGLGSGSELYTGSPSSVTVRGFGGDFTETLVDGRPQASAAGRTFDFASVGADFVSEVDVHKTPDFTLSSGAVGATVNIKFPKPFDHPGLQARAFASTTDTTNDGSFRPAGGALFSDTFFNDTLGVLVLGDYSDTRVNSHHLDIVGWKGIYLNSCQMAGGPACLDKNGTVIPKNSLVLGTDTPYNPVNPVNKFPSWYIQDYALWNDRTDDRRKDGRIAVQWRPVDTLLLTLDDTYSDDNISAMRFDYTTWFNAGRLYNVTQDSNGTITGFDHGPAPTDLDATYNAQYIQNNELGVNLKWDVTDQLTTSFDASQSSSHLNPHGELSQLQMDVGYGPSYNVGSANYAQNAANGFPNGYISGINVPGGSNQLPVYSTYGPNNNQANALGLNPLILGSHVAPLAAQRGTDIVNHAKIDVDWHSGGTDVDAGLQFTEDTRDAYSLNTFTNNAWQLWNGYGPRSGNTNGKDLPASLFANSSVINTSNYFSGFNNNNQLTPILQYNPWTVYNYLVSLGAGGANPNTISPVPKADGTGCTAGTLGCFSPYTGGPEPLGLDPGSVSHVQEKTYAPFVVIQEKLNVADRPLTANLGLRYERTTVNTGGYGRLPTSITVQSGDTTAFNFFYTPTQWLTSSHQYSYFLPSLDLNYSLLTNLKLRFDASRTLTRPPLNEITPTLSVGGRVGALTATGNNPGLLPYLSNNFDLGAEWYYGQNEYLAIDGFFKHVSQFPEQQVVNTNINGVTDPTTGGAPAVFAETTFLNAPSANVYGAELGWQHMIGYGFGTQINGTVVRTNQPYQRYDLTSHFYLPGLANSANFVGFYQNYGFQARIAVNFTAEQLISTTQEQSGGQFGNEPVFTRPFTEVDFSAQYDLNEHLSVFFKALNLTDQAVVEHGRFSNQILNIQDIGRTFTMGVRAKL